MTIPADFLGVKVIVSSALPIYPGHKEDARRFVRHGFADVLAWLGEDVGPKPGDPTHALLVDNTLHASAAFVGKLRDRLRSDP